MIELLVFLVAACNYLILHRSLLTKCLPILLCCILSYKARKDATIIQAKDRKKGDFYAFYATNLGIGMLLSAIGDACLFLDDQVPGGDPSKPSPFFLFGLFAFLCGHIQYIKIFYVSAGHVKHQIRYTIPFMLFFMTIMFPLFDVIWDTALYFPVIIYGCIIATMAYMGFHWYWHALGDDAPRDGLSSVSTRSKRAFIGAVFFCLSDSVLAWNKFVPKLLEQTASSIPIGHVLPFIGITSISAHDVVMVTYYIAQGLIASSAF